MIEHGVDASNLGEELLLYIGSLVEMNGILVSGKLGVDIICARCR